MPPVQYVQDPTPIKTAQKKIQSAKTVKEATRQDMQVAPRGRKPRKPSLSKLMIR